MQSFWGITVSVEASEKLVASCRLHSETVMHQGGRLDTRDEPKREAMLGNTDQHMGDAVGQNGRMGEGSEGEVGMMRRDLQKRLASGIRTIVGRCRRGSDVSPSFATEAARREHCVASAQPFCSLKVFLTEGMLRILFSNSIQFRIYPSFCAPAQPPSEYKLLRDLI